jgi:hypothetical protein
MAVARKAKSQKPKKVAARKSSAISKRAKARRGATTARKTATRKTAAKRPAARKAAAKKAPAEKATARTAASRSAGTAPKRAPAKRARKAAPGGRGAAPAKWINSLDEHADRNGQTLRTRNHDVIMRWASERKAKPATVPGTEHGSRPGVLRFDFPGYGGRTLQPIDWSAWFRPFDERNLIFLYQERMRDGRQSNFFRLENPEREDA